MKIAHQLSRTRVFLGALVLAMAALALIDDRLKDSPSNGYAPSDATWTLASEDFGQFWQGLSNSDVFERTANEVPNPTQNIELIVRKLTGIRPTPSRWRLWMGRKMLVASSGDSIGMCVRPGLLINTIHFVRTKILGRPGQDGIYQFKGLHYSWRDGFLIISSSRDYINSSLSSPSSLRFEAITHNEILLKWQSKPEGQLRITGTNALPVEGTIELSGENRDSPLTLAYSWPGTPLLSISTGDWRSARTLAVAVAPLLKRLPHMPELSDGARKVWQHWDFPDLPQDWDKGIDEYALALTDIKVSNAIPVPELAFAARCKRTARGRHPLESVFEEMDTVPYEWYGREGTIIPLLGENPSVCLGRHEKDWLATTNERLMRRLRNQKTETEKPQSVEADLCLTLSWEKAAKVAEGLLSHAAENSLLTEMNSDDLRHELLPKLRAVQELGEMSLRGNFEDGQIVFNGELARDTEK